MVLRKDALRLRSVEAIEEAERQELLGRVRSSLPTSVIGAYDEEGLPADVETRLSTFFRPHDDAFFEILGRRLPWRN